MIHYLSIDHVCCVKLLDESIKLLLVEKLQPVQVGFTNHCVKLE